MRKSTIAVLLAAVPVSAQTRAARPAAVMNAFPGLSASLGGARLAPVPMTTPALSPAIQPSGPAALALFAAPAAPSALPAAVAAPVQAAAAPLAAVAAPAAAAAVPAVAAREQLAETGRSLNASPAEDQKALETLYAGALVRRASAAVAAPASHSAAASGLDRPTPPQSPIAPKPAAAASDQVAAVNSAVSDLLAPFNDRFTRAKIVFSELATNAVRAVKALLSLDYRKEGEGGSVAFKVDRLSYSYPETEGAKPETEVKASVELDMLRVLSREQINAMGPAAAEFVKEFAGTLTKRLGPAATVDARVTRLEKDERGDLVAVGLAIDADIDPAKLPPDVDVKDVQFTGVRATLDLTLHGMALDVSVVGNPRAKEFAQDQRGFKEWIDALVARDAKTLRQIARFVKQLDGYAASITRKKP